MSSKNMHRPAPLAMWVVIVTSQRSRWIHYPSIARTRRASIAAYLRNYELPDTTWRECVRRGLRVARVTVEVSDAR